MNTITIKGLSKSYGTTQALSDVNLVLEPERIYGLLGRNGAGKTTLLNLITNKIFPSTGEIKLQGENVLENDRVLRNIFYMMEANLYPAAMKIREVLRWSKEFYPQLDDAYALSLCDKFGLNINKRVRELSTGYGSIMKAIIALASNASILIFDEPILGLDANHRAMFYRELIANYGRQPKTIVISTHLIEEIAEVLEEVIILKAGQIVLQQSVEDLLVEAYTVSGAEEQVERYLAGKKVIDRQALGRFKAATIHERLTPGDQALIRQLDLELGKVELQQLFISLTNAEKGEIK